MSAKQSFRLVNWRELVVGDEELVVALEEVGEDQDLISRWCAQPGFECANRLSIDARCGSDVFDAKRELFAITP
jgi:hypothetical protein